LRDEFIFKNIKETKISEFEMLVNCLQIDVLINMVRCELKDGVERNTLKSLRSEQLKSIGTDEIDLIKKQQNLEGIADNLIKKINLLSESYSKEIQ
jgi:hypothetical protein